MAGAAIHVREVSKSFGERAVLQDVSIALAPGSLVSIVGRSGCGKSTLLRLLVGLEKPTTGVIETTGSNARLVFQEPRLLPWASVARNVAVGLGREPQAQDRAIVDDVLSLVGLSDFGSAWPTPLSGGQRQRVALARALISNPDFLALDEPFGALDALTRLEMQGLLERVWLQQGFTATLVTHDVSEAVFMGDRVILLDQGRVAIDRMIPLERPRRRGDPLLGQIEQEILDVLFGAESRLSAAKSYT